MFTFRVADMTCGHCAGKIARGIAGADPSARVTVDIPGRLAPRDAAAAAEVGRRLPSRTGSRDTSA